MPRTRSLAWAELKIGILAVMAIAIAATLIFTLGGEGGYFWQRYRLKARFPNVAGVKQGSPVRLAGVEVGSVSEVQFVGAQVEIVMQLPESARERVRTTSTASIGSVSLLGEGAVDITASTEGEVVPEWGYVKAGRAPGQLADVAEQATKSLEQATQLIQDVRRGKGTIGKLFTDEQLFQEINGFVSAAEDVARHISEGRGTMGRLLRDPGAARSLEASLRNLDAITRRISAGEGSLGRLVQDEAFARSLTSATSNVDALTGKLNRGEGTAGKLVTDAALYNRMNSVADRLDKLVAELNQGRGTAGQLLHDKQLYENMNGAASELRSLVGDIRKDPKKYLNVKVSIF